MHRFCSLESDANAKINRFLLSESETDAKMQQIAKESIGKWQKHTRLSNIIRLQATALDSCK